MTTAKTIHDLWKQFRQSLSQYQLKESEFAVTMGKPDGTLFSDDTDRNHVWVTATNGVPFEVYNQKLPNKAGQKIMVGYRRNTNPRMLQVTRINNSYGLNPPSAEIPAGITKELQWGGSEPLYIAGEVFYPFLCAGNNGLVLTVYAGNFRSSTGTFVSLLHQTFDMTSHLPSTGAQMFALCVKDDGTLAIVAGATQTTPELCVVSDLPSMPDATYHALCGVRMYSGQDTILQAPAKKYTDLFDLRWGNGGVMGGSGYTPPATTADDDFQVGISGSWVKKTLAQVITILRTALDSVYYLATTTLNNITAPSGDVSLNSHKIVSLLDPTSAQDAATKNYVDLATATVATESSAGSMSASDKSAINISKEQSFL